MDEERPHLHFVVVPELDQDDPDRGWRLRRPRGVEITEAGRLLYRHAQSILRQAEIAQEEVAHVGGAPSGAVSLGLPSAAAEIVGVAMIRACRERLPLVRLRIVEGVSALLAEFTLGGRLDGSILFLEEAPRGLDVAPVLDEELFYVCSPRSEFARRNRTALTLAEAAETPLAMPGVGNSMRLIVDTACARSGLTIEPAVELDSLNLLKACVTNDIASTFLPWSVVAKEEAVEEVHVMKLDVRPFSRPLSICIPSHGARGNASNAVMDLLRLVIVDLVTSGAWQGVTLRG
jgi:DNA-binding transcriptional LysR family regulator